MNENTKPTTAEVAEIFRRLRALKSHFGVKPNKDERTVALIGACIAEGFNTQARIVGALTVLKIRKAHVESLLSYHTGTDPTRHAWQLGDDQRYRLLDKYA